MPSNGNSSDQQLLQQKAAFIQHSLPGLPSGRYQVSVQQSLNKSAAQGGGDITEGGLPSMTKLFGVTGPRYQLDQNAIVSAYPPPGATGEFSNSLAHVVLNQQKLPWLFSPYIPGKVPTPGHSSYTTTINGKQVTIDYDTEVPSYLAVLLLSATDLNGADIQKAVQQGTALDLVPAALQMANPGGSPLQGMLPSYGYSIFSHYLDLGAGSPLYPGVGLSASSNVNFIDLPVALFTALAPSMKDLNLMAHVREVDMTRKPLGNGKIMDLRQQFALVLGNRLPESRPTPTPGQVAPNPPLGGNLAVLVSFEAMENALREHTGTSVFETQVANNPEGFVRLVVLYQWSFYSLQDTSFEFENILKGLNDRDSSDENTVPFPNAQLRLPDPPSFQNPDNNQTVLQKMLASGYFPMKHLARIPDNESNKPIQTVSWYRGPCIPFGSYAPAINFLSDSDPQTAKPVFYASDQLLRFDPAVGQFDASYALAWELGRLIALQNKDFSVALYQWKKRVAQQYRLLLESQVLNDMYDDLLALYEQVGADEASENSAQALHRAALLHLNKLSASL